MNVVTIVIGSIAGVTAFTCLICLRFLPEKPIESEKLKLLDEASDGSVSIGIKVLKGIREPRSIERGVLVAIVVAVLVIAITVLVF